MRPFHALAFGALALPLSAFAADPHSYAQPDQVRVTHLDLDLKVDFPHKQLDGKATLKLDWKDPKAQSLVLDTRDLKIASIEAVDAAGKTSALKYALAPSDKELGSKLTIATPQHPSQVRIVYSTVPTASGLQWMTPAQTAGKQHPFMFSQSESIHARSWVPLQDTPSVRFTYDAHVHVPKELRASHERAERWRITRSTAISLHDGQADSVVPARDRGRRHRGAHEPVRAARSMRSLSVVEAAAKEFADTENDDRDDRETLWPVSLGPLRHARAAAELPVRRHGKSVHDVRDADRDRRRQEPGFADRARARAFVVRQPRDQRGWRDMWLNEGFTTYVENRIVEAVYGKAQADEEVDPAADELRGESIKDMPETRSAPGAGVRRPRSGRRRLPTSRTQGRVAAAHARGNASAATCSMRTCAAISITSRSRASRPTRCSRIWTRT